MVGTQSRRSILDSRHGGIQNNLAPHRDVMTPATDILPTRKELARFIDYTLLSPDATREDVARACAEAREHSFGCVCVNTSRVAQAYHFLEDSGVQVIAAVG